MADNQLKLFDGFTGKGYHNWRFCIKSLLQIGVANTLKRTNLKTEKFQTKNERITGLITCHVSDFHFHYIKDATSAFEVIECLDAGYDRNDKTMINIGST